jgi:hypothetical protein
MKQPINEIKRWQKLANIKESEVTSTPVVQNLEKKAFDFFNKPEVIALLKKEIDKLSPEKKEKLAKTSIQENETNDFSSFKSSVEKTIDDASLNEYDNAHDAIRGVVGGYKPGQEPTSIDKSVGTLLTNLGVANIMSMGFLPAITAMAIDTFGGTDIINTVSQAVGDGGVAAGLSVLVGLIGGGILWRLGKILKNEKVTGDTPLFEIADDYEYDDIEEPEFDDDHDIDAQKKFEDMIVDVPRLHQLMSSSHHRGKEVTINGVKVTDVTGIGNIFLENGEKLNSKEFANSVPDIKINNEPIDIPMMSSKPPAPLNYKSSDVYPPGSYMDEVVNKALKEHRRKQK